MHVRWHWMQTRPPSLSSCTTAGNRQPGWGKDASTRLTLTGLRASPRCCATKGSLSVTTGRWSGGDAGWTWLWQRGGSSGGPALTAVGSATQTSPGVYTALRTTTALSTTARLRKYSHIRVAPAGLECTWTGQAAPCPSTASPQAPSDTFILSIAPSRSPCTPGLGWRRMTAL